MEEHAGWRNLFSIEILFCFGFFFFFVQFQRTRSPGRPASPFSPRAPAGPFKKYIGTEKLNTNSVG